MAIYTTGKKDGFFFSDFFAILWGVQGVSILEIHYYEQLLLLGSYLVLNIKMKRKGSKTIISVFFSIRLWLEFLSLFQFAAISIRVL